MNIIEKHEPREYSAISSNKGVILCDRQEGAFLVLRFPQDLERLKALLETLQVNQPEAA